jgi:ribose 5-phosphate isomerase A
VAISDPPVQDFAPAVARALDGISPGATIGLGSGRAASAFIRALGARVRQGLHVRGVPTSEATAQLAREVGITLAAPDEVVQLDLTVDGADEVDPQLNLIKGLGGALVREKIVAAASRRLLILVGAEKLVAKLGARGVLPVEVVSFGMGWCARRLEALGCKPEPRLAKGRLVVTDNQNHILDCRIGALDDPQRLERDLLAIPGVVGTGLFLGMADTVVIQHGDSVQVRERATA